MGVVPGLHVHKQIVPVSVQESIGPVLYSLFDLPLHNQYNHFGKVPGFAELLLDVVGLDPAEFNQVSANYYESGQGIKAHVDLLKYSDVIVIFSFLSSVVMEFRRGEKAHGICLDAGDVVVLEGEARYEWTHGIEETLIDEFEGNEIWRQERISVTIRKLKE